MTPLSTLEFFQLVLPADGWKTLLVLKGERIKNHYWYQSLEEMAAAAIAFDAAGHTVYHANASFADPGPDIWVPNPKKPGKQIRNWDLRKRTIENVQALKSLRIDVDAGPGKPYRDAGHAYSATKEWVAGAAAPAPLYIASGGGLHAYWPLGVPVDGARWRQLALGLAAALGRPGGIVADSTVTCDLARILRPPGTHNRKSGAVLVRAGPGVPAYAVETLERAFGSPAAPTSFNGRTAEFDSANGGSIPPVGTTLEEAVANVRARSASDDADPALIAAGCAQVRNISETPPTGWYAIVGVFAHCGERGRQHAIGLATAPEWVPVIEEKLARWRERADGPTTCARFQSLHPAGCRGCPHQGTITSPIQLGRGPLPAAVAAPKPATLDLPKLPDPYFWKNGQLRLRLEAKKEEEEPKEITLADYPVFVQELQIGEREDGVSAVFRSWEPATQEWRTFPVLLKDLTGDRGRSALAHHGVVIRKRYWDHFQDFVHRIVNDYRAGTRYGQRYDQFGWKPEGFVLGQELLVPAGASRRIFGSVELERRAPTLAPKGAVGAWTIAANALFAEPAMVAHAFALLASFAAPLYPFTGAKGVTVVHLASPNSGAGKTTALEAGESVWGAFQSLQIGTRDTEVAKFVLMGVSNHLPVFWDELRYQDPEETKAYVLQATVGRDKNRGRQDGGLRADSYPWSTLLISTSNPSLVDTVRWDGAETAQAARIFEFEPVLPAGKTVADGRRLEEALKANAGTAGRAYLQWLVAHRAWAEAAVHRSLARYEQEVGGGADQRFIVRLLAVVAVAGAVARQLGLLAVDTQAVMAWAVAHARASMAKLAGDAFGDVGGILGGLVNDLLPAVLAMPGPVKPGPRDMTYTPIREPRGELRGRYEHEGRRLWLDERAVRAWMVKHKRSFNQLELALTNAKALTANRKKVLGAGTTSPSGQVRCWEIDMSHEMVAGLTPVIVETTNVVPMRRA